MLHPMKLEKHNSVVNGPENEIRLPSTHNNISRSNSMSSRKQSKSKNKVKNVKALEKEFVSTSPSKRSSNHLRSREKRSLKKNVRDTFIPIIIMMNLVKQWPDYPDTMFIIKYIH